MDTTQSEGHVLPAAGVGPVLDRTGVPIDRHYFVYEGCGIFAATLARRHIARGQRASLYVLSDPQGEPFSEEHGFQLTHVIVRTDAGYFDVFGPASAPEGIAQRISLAHCDVKGPWYVSQFEEAFMGDDDSKALFGKTSDTVDEATRLIDASPHLYGL